MSKEPAPHSLLTDHVDLQRRFVDFDPTAIGERDDLTYSLASYYYAPKTWTDILESRCTVVIAEAGNGKTEELRYQAIQQRSAGRASFFCRLELLAAMSLEDAIEIGSIEEFVRWKDNNEKGWFFLDSVDEARLQNLRDFERGIVNFVKAVEPFKQRICAVISTRPNAWQAYADHEMLNRRLAIAPTTAVSTAAPAVNSSQNSRGAETSDAGVVTGSQTGQSISPAVSVLQLAPLNEEQVRTFARARGVQDLDAFVEAIERADADVFATRPADLPGLIDLWKSQRRIGRYSEVVQNNIRLKLRETNPRHQQSTIAEDRAVAGAEMLAAAVTLCRRTSILLPDQPVDDSLKSTSLDPLEVLPKWTPSEIQALLGRALFDESLYGTVRFHHRTAREYLAARWFERLLHKGKMRRAVERVFFGQPYGTEPEITAPSMKSVVGWLATTDQAVRDKVFRVDPCVLLEYGDASALDVDTRGLLLKEYANRYRNRKYTPISLNVREVRRLADSRLANAVRALLTNNINHDDVRELMLRIIREGRITACCDLALKIALSDPMDDYTRSCAVQCIGVAGTSEQKQELLGEIIAKAAELPRQVVAAAIEALWPAPLTISQMAELLATVQIPKRFSADQLDVQAENLASRVATVQEKTDLLRRIVALLQTPPLHDDGFCRISQRHDWLLTMGAGLAFSILAETPDNVDRTLLATISMCEQSDHLKRYSGDADGKAEKLIQANHVFRRALFWFELEQARATSKEPIKDWWSSQSGSVHSLFLETDVSSFLDNVKNMSAMDDRLVALSVLITLWRSSGEPQNLLTSIRDAVKGEDELERTLRRHLEPRPESSERKRYEEERAARKEKDRARKHEDERNRKAWIKGLRANPKKVGDLQIAPEGKVWKNTYWLLDELRKIEDDRNHWTVSKWELLVPEFGTEVVNAFRKFCQKFWRKYIPRLRSEGGEDSSIPAAVVVGLSGLAMDARNDRSWATKLTPDEAKIAARYALLELNNLPEWFSSIHSAQAEAVDDVLITEIRWELYRKESVGLSYALARLRWSAQALAEHLRIKIVEVLSNTPTRNVVALAEALTVVLRDPSPLPQSFIDLAAKKARKGQDIGQKALWIAALLALDADRAIATIEAWVGQSKNVDGEQKVTMVLNSLWGDELHSLNSQHRDYMRPDILLRLLRIAHTHIRSEDDISHDEAYSPVPRDHAQRARGHLLELLCGIPGPDTHAALIKLSHFHARQFSKDQMLVLADRRAEEDLQFDAWLPSQVVEFYEDADRNPISQRDLFDLAYSRLDDLKLELEEGDESEASVIRRINNETELRRLIANRLKQSARGKFTTGSEEELADKSRTDIRLHNPAVDARIPIEIKIAGRWTASELVERLENQLVAQYMREAKWGIFLIVNRLAPNDRVRWRVSNSSFEFAQLLRWLGDQKRGVLKRHEDIQSVEIVGIDLSVRNPKERAGHKGRDRDRKRQKSRKVRRRTQKSAQPARKLGRRFR